MKTLLPLLLGLSLMGGDAPSFKAQVIDNQIDIGYGLAIGDVDGDKRPDILLADKKEIVWYRNTGKETWPRYVMAANLTEKDNVCIAARDLDGDGKVEVAVGAQWDPGETHDPAQSGAVFYLVRPADPTQTWEAVRLPHEPTTHRMKWAKVGKNKFQLIVVPLHGRDNKNGEGRGVKILAYEFPENPKGEWKTELVDSTLHMAHNAEVWEDGRETKLIVAAKEGCKILRYTGGKWQHEGEWIGKDYPAGEVKRGLSSDKKPLLATVSPMHGNELVVFRDNRPTVLFNRMAQGHAVVCADFLGLGYSQVATGWRMPNGDRTFGVRLFTPDGTGWKQQEVDESIKMACEDLQAADLDLDGDPDLIASGRSTLNVVVYWNLRK